MTAVQWSSVHDIEDACWASPSGMPLVPAWSSAGQAPLRLSPIWSEGGASAFSLAICLPPAAALSRRPFSSVYRANPDLSLPTGRSDRVRKMDRNEDSTPGGPVAIPILPASARLPINRCNLPAVILGSLTFQRHPEPLLIDGVAELHADLFQRLDRLADPEKRASQFMDYMVVRFRLARLEEAGLDNRTRRRRVHADYLHLVRGWSFSPDGREGAALKG